ncbi:MAG: CcmD family protein [SAR202 cluster bacterium]|nr:CcmD family protein [SAR202 cluster bacterium]
MSRMKTKSLIAFVTTLLPSYLLTIPALAQDGSNQSVVDTGANLDYLFITFAITWIIFFGYLYYIAQKQKTLSQELDDIKKDK